MKMNCIAVDDEALALSKISRYAEKIEYLNLLNCFDNAIDSLYYLKQNEVHLIFLDIQMDDLTGIQLIESLQNPPLIIFTTAFDAYALKGYELNVTDYLLKPIQFDRFLKACEKAYTIFLKNEQLRKLTIPTISKDIENEGAIFIKSGNSMVKIFFDDILYIEGMKDYLAIYTSKNRILTLQNFNTMLQQLPEDKFFRIHKSYIVALNKIVRIDKNEIFIGEKSIPIGITFKNAFQTIWKNKIR